jgi:proteasome assembly chaperone (PAC2) family protein
VLNSGDCPGNALSRASGEIIGMAVDVVSVERLTILNGFTVVGVSSAYATPQSPAIVIATVTSKFGFIINWN